MPSVLRHRNRCEMTVWTSHLQGLPTNLDTNALSAKMDGYSGDDIRAVCHDASMNGMRPVMAGKSKDEIMAMDTMAVSPPVTAKDFEEVTQRPLPPDRPTEPPPPPLCHQHMAPIPPPPLRPCHAQIA